MVRYLCGGGRCCHPSSPASILRGGQSWKLRLLHPTPSLSEDHPLPSPSDCAQLRSLHPVIQLLYPPPDCTQLAQTLTLVSLGSCSRGLFVLSDILRREKAGVAAEEGQSDLRSILRILRILSIPARSSGGERRGPDGAGLKPPTGGHTAPAISVPFIASRAAANHKVPAFKSAPFVLRLKGIVARFSFKGPACFCQVSISCFRPSRSVALCGTSSAGLRETGARS